jgi:hypothetical protein
MLVYFRMHDTNTLHAYEYPRALTRAFTPQIPANQVLNITWSMQLTDGHGVAPMVLQTGDADFDYNMHLLSDVYNMWAGKHWTAPDLDLRIYSVLIQSFAHSVLQATSSAILPPQSCAFTRCRGSL